VLFDLIIDPILVEAGQERKSLPGLFAGSAPRRAARLRGQDRAIFLFTQAGSALLAPNLQQEMLSRLAETYFTSSGSVTAGMRATVERLNDFLLNRNLRGARQGGQLSAALSMTVLHGDSLHVIAATPAGVEHFFDPSARSLGQARVASLRFFTSTLVAGSLLLFAPERYPEWSDANLRAWAATPVEELHHRLIGQALERVGGAVGCQNGRGEIAWTTPLRPEPAPAAVERKPAARPAVPLGSRLAGIFLSGKPLARPAEQVTAAQAVESASSGPSIATPEPVEVPPEAAPVGPAAHLEVVSLPDAPAESRAAPARQAVRARTETTRAPTAARPQGPSKAAVAAAKAATGGFSWLRKAKGVVGRAFSKLMARAIPGQPAEGLSISPSTMLFVAIAVPLVVVSIAAAVYFQRGRGEQYQAFLRTARQFSEQAGAQQDSVLQREDWNQALYWLDKAAVYGKSDEGDQLKRNAQQALDGMDGILRLTFQPVGGTLPKTANITRMVATINDVYMLDSTSGSVFRLYRTGSGYELDTSFICGPGKAGSAIIGPLLDIVPLPPNNEYKASVMGIDAGGNLEYCAANVSGFSSATLTPPDSNWGEISRMVLYQDVLFVLDPKVNAVYRYVGDKGSIFTSGPRLYFDNQVPTMSDVVDIAVDQENLYLLHEDGSMTTCSDAGFSTECADPSPYGDGRSGREPAPLLFEGSHFTRLQATQPPDPSLYILDRQANSIYQFSLRKLNLQRQYRAGLELDYPLPERSATAFAVTPNRRVTLAFGDQVFFASLP
jgi:hypothetical protein